MSTKILPESDYPYRMWKLCRTDLIKWWVKQGKSEGFKWETYQSFRNYIWWLTRLGLIECVASKQSDER